MNAIVSISRTLGVASVALMTLGMISTPSTFAERGSMKLQHVTTMADVAKVKPGDTIVVTCPKCKDTYTSVVDKSFKGKVDEKTGTLALSPAEETKVEGQGANPGDKLTHVCKVCGSDEVICCVTKKGEGASEEKKKK